MTRQSSSRQVWTDQMMLDALHMRDDLSMSAAKIGKALGVSRAAVCGMFKRISDDEAKAEGRQA